MTLSIDLDNVIDHSNKNLWKDRFIHSLSFTFSYLNDLYFKYLR